MNKLQFIIAGGVLLACPAFADSILTNGGFESPPGTTDFSNAGWTNFTTTGSGVERQPWLRRRVVRALAADSDAFSRILRILVTDSPVSSLGLGSVARLAHHLVIS